MVLLQSIATEKVLGKKETISKFHLVLLSINPHEMMHVTTNPERMLASNSMLQLISRTYPLLTFLMNNISTFYT
jgi:hypothetical protein